jgi:hypothetical protein
MILTLQRKSKISNALLGQLEIGGVNECFTLENADLAIPCGHYKVEITYSPRFQRDLPLIDVPGRTGIRIHPANWAHQLEGCIAPGQTIEGNAVDNSRAAFDPLFHKIEEALYHEESVYLEVKGVPVPA